MYVEAVEIIKLQVLNCLLAIDLVESTSLQFNKPNNKQLLFPILQIPEFESPCLDLILKRQIYVLMPHLFSLADLLLV